MQSVKSQLDLLGFDHLGVRVVNRERSIAFYGQLGFFSDPDADMPTERLAELINANGVRLNLIVNGEAEPGGRNVLLDMPEKRPGWTHPAFIVDSLDAVIAWAGDHEITITEGPSDWGRRRVCFVRDPDNNVIEFDELTGCGHD
jgi:catechol 2,3-dioxygenase-like lactoylglutathione lyase family enzyme